MASDLIPPPSPAGKPPSPDGPPRPSGTPNLIELPPEPPRAGSEPAMATPPPGPSEFRNRFGFLFGALAGVFIAAAIAAAIVIANPGGSNGSDEGLAANWSSWQPSDNSIDDGAQEIATHVGSQYTHPDGAQLVDVKGSELPSDLQLVLRPSSGPIVHIEGNRVLYELDGLGPNQTILGGTPSVTRMAVIQREALELALYTFRYLPDAESVVVLLPKSPPNKEQQAAITAATAAAASGAPVDTSKLPEQPALFYRPGDLKQQLQTPLGNTLAAKAPSTDSFSGPEADNVATLTKSNLFIVQASGSQVVLVRPDTP